MPLREELVGWDKRPSVAHADKCGPRCPTISRHGPWQWWDIAEMLNLSGWWIAACPTLRKLKSHGITN